MTTSATALFLSCPKSGCEEPVELKIELKSSSFAQDCQQGAKYSVLEIWRVSFFEISFMMLTKLKVSDEK